MPTSREDCPNWEINQQMCPCTNEGCPNHGICCECVQAHAAVGKLTACMRVERPFETIRLRGQVPCTHNLERNQAFCPCGASDCVRRGTCCECIRNHWLPDGSGRVACLRGLE